MTTSAADGASGVRRFPPGFLWGASSSALQIEGAAAEDGRGPSIWDTFSHTPGKIRGGDTCDVACNSYHRLDDDLRMLTELGVKAYRFSISWSRVQPDGRGPVNRPGLDYYRMLIEGLRERDIVPVATLYHWDLPQALEDRGGWASRETAVLFSEYAALLSDALGDQIGMWLTLNEPWVAAHQGYRIGTHAPGHIDNDLAAAATHHLLLGHGLAVQAIRAARPGGPPVGITLDLHPVRAAGEDAADASAAVDAEQNRIFLDPVLHGRYPAGARPELLPPSTLIKADDMDVIAAPIDFLGINYYCPYYVKLSDWSDLRLGETPLPGHPGVVMCAPPELNRTIMDWIVEPAGLYDLLISLTEETRGLPLYVTESGCACEDYITHDGECNDFERVAYLHGHFDAAARAIEDGANLAGYFVWSLMDNFELAWGYQRRFGLYYVDFTTQHRTPKRSAAFYSGVTRSGVLPALDAVLSQRDFVPPSSRSAAPTAAAYTDNVHALRGRGHPSPLPNAQARGSRVRL
jgi:beta-glucosidase